MKHQELETTIDGVSDGFAKISGDLTLHYQSAGNGPLTIVLVPGWTMTTAAFDKQLKHFTDSDLFTALAFDPRAQGLSTVTIEGHHYEQHAHDLNALLEVLDVDNFVLVGWSAGGMDVLEYLRIYGRERCKGLVLLEAWPKARAHDFEVDWVPFGTKENGDQDDFLKALVLDLMVDRQSANRMFAEWMLSDVTPEALRLAYTMTASTPDSIAALLNVTYWFLDETELVQALDGMLPMLFFTREEQGALAKTWAQAHAPHARVLSHGSHMSFWEEPQHFNSALDDFLTELP